MIYIRTAPIRLDFRHLASSRLKVYNMTNAWCGGAGMPVSQMKDYYKFLGVDRNSMRRRSKPPSASLPASTTRTSTKKTPARRRFQGRQRGLQRPLGSCSRNSTTATAPIGSAIVTPVSPGTSLPATSAGNRQPRRIFGRRAHQAAHPSASSRLRPEVSPTSCSSMFGGRRGSERSRCPRSNRRRGQDLEVAI